MSVLRDSPELAQALEQYCEDRKRFVVGFARFVISRGHGAFAPMVHKDKQGRPMKETWQAVGRRLYGAINFEAALKAELAARQEAPLTPAAIPCNTSQQGTT